jgi:hypothetical protein
MGPLFGRRATATNRRRTAERTESHPGSGPARRSMIGPDPVIKDRIKKNKEK